MLGSGDTRVACSPLSPAFHTLLPASGWLDGSLPYVLHVACKVISNYFVFFDSLYFQSVITIGICNF